MMKSKGSTSDRLLTVGIFIVIVLLFVVGSSILTKEHTAPEHLQRQPVGEKQEEEMEKEEKQETEEKEQEEKEEVQQGPKDELIQSESEKPDVLEVWTNEAWGPIGTEQEEPHVSKFDGQSQDWIEKKAAIAAPLSYTEEELTYIYVQGGSTAKEAIGTVQSKEDGVKYRVYIEWVDERGWKPVRVERLK